MADGLGAYRALLVPDGAWRFSLAGWVARLYRVGTVVGAILLLAGTGTDYALAGAASAAIVVGSALGGPAWSRLADRVGQRPVLPLAAVCGLAAIAAFVLAVLAGAPVATWLPLALAVGAATIDPGALVRARWMHVLPDRDRRHAALALESANDELAFLLGLPAVTLAAAVAPWSGIVGAAVLGAAGLGALALLRRSIPPVAPPPERHGRLRGPGWRAWLPVGVAPALPAFVGIGMLFGYINLAGVAIADAAGTPAVAGAVIGAFSIGAVAAGLVWGVVGRRLPERARLPIATAGFVALVPLLGVAHDPLGFGVLGAVAGCGMTPLLIASVASIEGRSPLATITVAMTWPPVAMSAGNAASSTLTGVVLDGGGSPATWWIPLVAVALAIVALLVSARSPRTSRAPRIRAPQPRARG